MTVMMMIILFLNNRVTRVLDTQMLIKPISPLDSLEMNPS
jgi:hypothetical protein